MNLETQRLHFHSLLIKDNNILITFFLIYHCNFHRYCHFAVRIHFRSENIFNKVCVCNGQRHSRKSLDKQSPL